MENAILFVTIFLLTIMFLALKNPQLSKFFKMLKKLENYCYVVPIHTTRPNSTYPPPQISSAPKFDPQNSTLL